MQFKCGACVSYSHGWYLKNAYYGGCMAAIQCAKLRTCSSTVLVMGAGNLPALLRPGPSRRGICLMTESEAKNAW